MKPAHDIEALSDDMITVETIRPAVNLDEMMANYTNSGEDIVAENIQIEALAKTVQMNVSPPPWKRRDNCYRQ